MVKLESVQDDKIEQIIIFLANFENQKRGEDFWRRRLKFWWEDNPCYNSNFCRGWILVENKENIVGFMLEKLHQLSFKQFQMKLRVLMFII